MADQKPIRAALYARVSTREQDAGSQIEDLRRVATQRGWQVVGEYADHAQSGTKDRRPELDRMLKDVCAGKIALVACIKIDRLGRSLKHLVTLLEDFRVRNVAFVSASDGLDSTTSAGRMALGMVGVMAQFERELISERTRASLAYAKRCGKRLGRPRVHVDIAQALYLRSKDLKMTEIARRQGVGLSTLRRELQAARERGVPVERTCTRIRDAEIAGLYKTPPPAEPISLS